MIPKTIDAITENDIQNLIIAGAEESTTLEFKSQLVGSDRDARKEFLADICALANTQGGDMLFGLSETADGQAESIVPQTFSPDAEILRLTNTLNDGLEPKLHGIVMRAIDVQGGRVLVARVPRSIVGIHRVKPDGQFYVRESRSKRGLDVSGIRSKFAEAFGREDRVTSFFARRYSDILADTFPVNLTDSPKVVLHIVPNRAFLDGEEVDISEFSQPGQFWTMPGIRSAFCTHTFEGALHHRPVGSELGEVRSATLVFRSGLVEAVGELVPHAPEQGREQFIFYEQIEALFVEFLENALNRTVELLSLGYPVTIRMAIVGAHRYRAQSISRDANENLDNVAPVRVHTPILQLPDVYLEERPSSVPLALQKSFDRLWQAWGYPKSYCFKTGREGQTIWQGKSQ
ncbi:MAG: ATP-binding protein [Rhodoferax sp.]|uniref:AlbA family DNA-binding domain-containing protein n=1 Tax=Rhodoferax sp. TaxID=50421 RepID=UPI002720F4D8|nr:ATP-binding protein [Rhodoferax sp.]MDO8450338.1 ATP-binding protein [Rhodoferax sp.]